jgi:hypothetical protein
MPFGVSEAVEAAALASTAGIAGDDVCVGGAGDEQPTQQLTVTITAIARLTANRGKVRAN